MVGESLQQLAAIISKVIRNWGDPMLILVFQAVYMLFLILFCLFICQQIQSISRKGLEHLAKRKGYSKEKTIWIPRGSGKLIATPSNELEYFVTKPMLVISLLQPLFFMIIMDLGIFISKIIFQ